MRTDWDQVPVRRLVDYYIGGGWGKEEIDDTHTEGAFVVRGTDLPSAQFGDVSGVPYRYHKPANLSSRRLRPNDIVFEVSGGSKDQPVGRALLISESLLSSLGDAAMCASFCKLIRIDPEVASARFFFYYLSMIYNDRRIMEYQTQSTGISNFKFEAFLDGHHIPLPPREIQMRVAAVLAAYDELIENNLRRIEILEEMAQAVYREWFVNFRFPGHEHVGLVDSPLGPIPEGWEARKFGTIADEIKDGVDPSTVDADVRYVGLEHIPQESFTLTEWGSAADVSSRKWRFTSGDVLFGKLRPYFHKVVEASFEGICSTDAIVIRPANGFGDLALQVAFSKEFVAHAVATSGGTDRPRAKWADLANFGVVVPDAATRALFSRSVRPMVDLAAKLARQNANLRTTRDLLLPKLVSGEIDVSDLDIDTEWLAS